MLLHERHYTIRQLAKLTGINYHTLRRRLLNAHGVVNLQTRRNTCIRIPESVWNRIYSGWTMGRP